MKIDHRSIDFTRIDSVSVDQLWTNFAGFIGLANASELQRREMRKAFFAGFHECMALVRDVIPQLDDAVAVRVLERFSGETETFFNKLVEETDASKKR